MQKKQKKYINLVNSINYIIRKKNLIRPGEPVLLTISGGQDSIILLFIFLQLKNHWNLSLGIIYCNHLWQSEFFYTTSLLVKLAYLFKLPFYSSVTSKKILTEQKARNWRYKMFQRLCFMSDYPLISTGHTATDRVETVLFQFTRGTSANGFFCLNWSTEFFKNKNFTTFYSSKSIPLVEKINPKSTKENIFLMFNLESMKFMPINKNLRLLESKNSKKIYEFVDFLNCSKVLKHPKGSLDSKNTTRVAPFALAQKQGAQEDYFFFPTLGWLLNQCFFYFLLYGGSFFFFKENLKTQQSFHKKKFFFVIILIKDSTKVAPFALAQKQEEESYKNQEKRRSLKLIYKKQVTKKKYFFQLQKLIIFSPKIELLKYAKNHSFFEKPNFSSSLALKKKTSPLGRELSSSQLFLIRPESFIRFNKISFFFYFLSFQKKWKVEKDLIWQSNFLQCQNQFLLDETSFRVKPMKLDLPKKIKTWNSKDLENSNKLFFVLGKKIFRKFILTRTELFSLLCFFTQNQKICFTSEIKQSKPSKRGFKWGQLRKEGKVKPFWGKTNICKNWSFIKSVNRLKVSYSLIYQPYLSGSKKRVFRQEIEISRISLLYNYNKKFNQLNYFYYKFFKYWLAWLKNFFESEFLKTKKKFLFVGFSRNKYRWKNHITFLILNNFNPKKRGLSTLKKHYYLFLYSSENLDFSVTSLTKKKGVLLNQDFLSIKNYLVKNMKSFSLSENQPVRIKNIYKKILFCDDWNNFRLFKFKDSSNQFFCGLNLNFKFFKSKEKKNLYLKQKLTFYFNSNNLPIKLVQNQPEITVFLNKKNFYKTPFWFFYLTRIEFSPKRKKKELKKIKLKNPIDRIVMQNKILLTNKHFGLNKVISPASSFGNIKVVHNVREALFFYEQKKQEGLLVSNKTLFLQKEVLEKSTAQINSRKTGKKFFTFFYWKKLKKNFSIENIVFSSTNVKFNFIKKFPNKLLIIRPILLLNRFDIKKLCNVWHLPLYPDKSNQKIQYYRNRIRKQLLPTLRFFFNPQIDIILFQFIEIANAEQIYLNYITNRIIQQIKFSTSQQSTPLGGELYSSQLFYNSNNKIDFNLSLFNFFPLSIRRRILKIFLEKITNKKITFFHIEKILEFIDKKTALTSFFVKNKNFTLSKNSNSCFLEKKDFPNENQKKVEVLFEASKTLFLQSKNFDSSNQEFNSKTRKEFSPKRKVTSFALAQKQEFQNDRKTESLGALDFHYSLETNLVDLARFGLLLFCNFPLGRELSSSQLNNFFFYSNLTKVLYPINLEILFSFDKNKIFFYRQDSKKPRVLVQEEKKFNELSNLTSSFFFNLKLNQKQKNSLEYDFVDWNRFKLFKYKDSKEIFIFPLVRKFYLSLINPMDGNNFRLFQSSWTRTLFESKDSTKVAFASKKKKSEKKNQTIGLSSYKNFYKQPKCFFLPKLGICLITFTNSYKNKT